MPSRRRAFGNQPFNEDGRVNEHKTSEKHGNTVAAVAAKDGTTMQEEWDARKKHEADLLQEKVGDAYRDL